MPVILQFFFLKMIVLWTFDFYCCANCKDGLLSENKYDLPRSGTGLNLTVVRSNEELVRVKDKTFLN